MNVGELVAVLATLPPNTEVHIGGGHSTRHVDTLVRTSRWKWSYNGGAPHGARESPPSSVRIEGRITWYYPPPPFVLEGRRWPQDAVAISRGIDPAEYDPEAMAVLDALAAPGGVPADEAYYSARKACMGRLGRAMAAPSGTVMVSLEEVRAYKDESDFLLVARARSRIIGGAKKRGLKVTTKRSGPVILGTWG